ncbi:ficolin-2-like [Penaeus chinensis]|uniref:ficolin-2-like n=1 Tax=Penaeus chinensis TaxID=139456 RepID=UPI001FB77E8D|nr:ficolin-2-like [Penaeus chinensis]
MTLARALMVWLCMCAAQKTSGLESNLEAFPGTLYSLRPRSSSRTQDIIDTLDDIAEGIPYALPFTSRDSQNARQETTDDPFQNDKNVSPEGDMAPEPPKVGERDVPGGEKAGEEEEEENKEGQDAGHNLTTAQEEEMAEREVLRRKIWELQEANRNLLGQILLKDRRYPNQTGIQQPHETRDTEDGSSSKGLKSFRPADCADHLVHGATVSGVYDIYPFTCLCTKPVQVWCDMDTDGGGWTVFFKREKNLIQERFNRSWSEYKDGFGNPSSEYWLGNELLHTMTSSREYTLRMDLQLATGDFKSGVWKRALVDDEIGKYKLTLSDYLPESSTTSNCMSLSHNRFFSTYDRDHDGSSSNCAADKQGGWWHYSCTSGSYLYPTSLYPTGLASTCYNGQGVAANWIQFKLRPAVCGTSFKTVYLNSYACDSCH